MITPEMYVMLMCGCLVGFGALRILLCWIHGTIEKVGAEAIVGLLMIICGIVMWVM